MTGLEASGSQSSAIDAPRCKQYVLSQPTTTTGFLFITPITYCHRISVVQIIVCRQGFLTGVVALTLKPKNICSQLHQMLLNVYRNIIGILQAAMCLYVQLQLVILIRKVTLLSNAAYVYSLENIIDP